ncbi:polysaccharide deacetylase family protein [Gorillibacterium timonense]|uniref:polysaccharide deacetylase family protein n=1 Tax=Gorillibacterium timonense TaxID=1689269 RepID=UPI00071D6DC2|nr:polysaccharide deacetylase family protein [Gorillibacterium timonense]
MNGANSKQSWLTKMTAAVMAVFLLLGDAGAAVASAEAQASGDSSLTTELYQTLSSGKLIPAASTPDGAADRSSEKVVYLTFDDGPSKLTPEVLDILRAEEVKATFFELGELAELRPQIVKRVVEEGHALGNHSYNHVYKELYGSYEAFWGQVSKTEDILFKITGIRTSLLRPPGGSYTNFDSFYFYLLEQAGYRVFDWNVDSTDASRRGVPAESIENAVLKAPLKNQMVVLMHDGAGHEETVKALPAIIRHFKENGYRFEKLDSDVSPVQFRLGKAKWKRSMGKETFAKLLEASRTHASLYGKPSRLLADGAQADSIKAGGKSAIRTSGGSAASKGTGGIAGSTGSSGAAGDPFHLKQPDGLSPPVGGKEPLSVEKGKLIVRLNGTVWTLSEKEYELTAGRFMISVPALASQLGAWYKEEPYSKPAVLQYGLSRLILRGSDHSVIAAAPGRKETIAPLLLLPNGPSGEQRIALRTAIELLGGRITGFAVSGTGGVVEAECSPRLLYLSGLQDR